jgi:hypothetical protein
MPLLGVGGEGAIVGLQPCPLVPARLEGAGRDGRARRRPGVVQRKHAAHLEERALDTEPVPLGAGVVLVGRTRHPQPERAASSPPHLLHHGVDETVGERSGPGGRQVDDHLGGVPALLPVDVELGVADHLTRPVAADQHHGDQ